MIGWVISLSLIFYISIFCLLYVLAAVAAVWGGDDCCCPCLPWGVCLPSLISEDAGLSFGCGSSQAFNIIDHRLTISELPELRTPWRQHPNNALCVVMILSVNTGIDSLTVSKRESVMKTTGCRWKLHIGPLVGDPMLDELSNCYPARR